MHNALLESKFNLLIIKDQMIRFFTFVHLLLKSAWSMCIFAVKSDLIIHLYSSRLHIKFQVKIM
jgi:hypothetical protein